MSRRIPDARQTWMEACLTARTCSMLAPPFRAPLRCPLSWGFTCCARISSGAACRSGSAPILFALF